MTKSKKSSTANKKVELIGTSTKTNDRGYCCYETIRINKSADEVITITTGNMVYLASGGAEPYIAIIDEIYIDNDEEHMCKCTWFYRRNDVCNLHPTCLDKVDIRDNDLFFSKDSDDNSCDLIINICNILFIYADIRKPELLENADYICSYRFSPLTGTITRLSNNQCEKYQLSSKSYEARLEYNLSIQNYVPEKKEKNIKNTKFIQLGFDDTNTNMLDVIKLKKRKSVHSLSAEDINDGCNIVAAGDSVGMKVIAIYPDFINRRARRKRESTEGFIEDASIMDDIKTEAHLLDTTESVFSEFGDSFESAAANIGINNTDTTIDIESDPFVGLPFTINEGLTSFESNDAVLADLSCKRVSKTLNWENSPCSSLSLPEDFTSLESTSSFQPCNDVKNEIALEKITDESVSSPKPIQENEAHLNPELEDVIVSIPASSNSRNNMLDSNISDDTLFDEDLKNIHAAKRKSEVSTWEHQLPVIKKKRRIINESSVSPNMAEIVAPSIPIQSLNKNTVKSSKVKVKKGKKKLKEKEAELLQVNNEINFETAFDEKVEETTLLPIEPGPEPESLSEQIAELESDDLPQSFQRMCELTRPQIIAKYSSSKVLSETEVVAILEQLWEGMDANERRSYLNPEYNPFKRDTASAEFDALGGTLDSDDSDMEQTRPQPKSSAVLSIEKDSDDEREDDAEKMEGAKQPAIDPIMTRSRAQLDETYMRGSFVNDKSRAEQPKNPTRIGDSFQASIPELSLNPKSDLKGNGALLSQPSDFTSTEYPNYQQSAKEACFTVALRLLAEYQSSNDYRIDGSLLIFSTPLLTLALETLNERHSDGITAVVALENKVRKSSTIWCAEEQKSAYSVFRKYNDNINKLKDALPLKTTREILEFMYKFLVSAQSLEEDISSVLGAFIGSKRNRPRPESEDEDDEDEKRSEKAVDFVAAAGNGRAVTRGVTRGFKPPEKASSHEPEKFISLAREYLEDFSFIMVVNSFIQLRKRVISPVQLFVRARNIIENSSAGKNEREALHVQLLKLLPQGIRRFLNIKSITGKSR